MTKSRIDWGYYFPPVAIGLSPFISLGLWVAHKSGALDKLGALLQPYSGTAAILCVCVMISCALIGGLLHVFPGKYSWNGIVLGLLGIEFSLLAGLLFPNISWVWEWVGLPLIVVGTWLIAYLGAQIYKK